MPTSRRRFLRAGATTGTVTLLGGCTGFGGGDATVRRLVVDLTNGTTEPHSFHLAVETAGGLGEWRTASVPADDAQTVTVEPPDDRAFVAVHGVVADRAVRVDAELIDFRGPVCPHLVFRYHFPEDDPVTFTFTTETTCDRVE